MTPEDRENFVDNLFESIDKVDAKTLTDLNTDRKKILKAWNGLDPDTRNTVFKYVKLLVREKTRNILPQKKEKPSGK